MNQAKSSSVSFTRPADTTAYTALDVVGATAAALQFQGVRAGGSQIELISASLRIDHATAIADTFRLHFYNVTPPSALADNAAFDLPAGDRSAYLGYITLPQPVDLGSTQWSQLDDIQKIINASTTKDIYAYLQAVGGFTPASAVVHTLTLHFR